MNYLKEFHSLCINNNISIATAESCTAGLLASEITSIAGASLFFRGGIIAYQNNIKINNLSVSSSLIKNYTEVSAIVVEKMAESIRQKLLADVSIATSGYAGPEGGTDENPVGTVFIAISSKDKTVSRRFSFLGDRRSVVSQAVRSSLKLIVEHLKKQ